MSLLRFVPRNHPQQVRLFGPRPDVDDRTTAPEVFGPLHERFGFTIDVAASDANARLPRYYTIEDDGLRRSWEGERVWCNPPYSNIRPWLEKAWGEDALTVMILPANRTEQSWWQDLVEPYRDGKGYGLTTEFLAGRIRFIRAGAHVVGPNERPPFGSVLLIWARP